MARTIGTKKSTRLLVTRRTWYVISLFPQRRYPFFDPNRTPSGRVDAFHL